MKPIYFPFTYVSKPVAEALSACFGQFVVYRPVSENLSEQMQLWVNRGVVDLRVPVTEHENELKKAVKNYQIWADLHGQDTREKTAIIKTHIASMPFFSEFSSSKIVENIKEKIHDSSKSSTPAPVLAARIFLYFAQEFDRQNDELTEALTRYDQQETELIHQLKMEVDPVAGDFRKAPQHLPDSFADYMISDRLEAWTRVFCQVPEVSGIYVTHSTAILQYLLDRTPTAPRVMRIESIPLGRDKTSEQEAWQKRLALNLERLIDPKQEPSGDESTGQLDLSAADSDLSLSVYRVPNQAPQEFFSHSVEMNCCAADGVGPKPSMNSTLIALVQGSALLC